jgi:hypothetical protein
MAGSQLEPGLYEVLLTAALEQRISEFETARLTPEIRPLANADAADRLSRHLDSVVTRAIEALKRGGPCEGWRAPDHATS